MECGEVKDDIDGGNTSIYNKKKIVLCGLKQEKMKVETKTWQVNEEELSHEYQLSILDILTDENNKSKSKSKSKSNCKCNKEYLKHIRNKLSAYKQQDIKKDKYEYNEEKFISLEQTLELLKKSKMKCYYCDKNLYILYNIVRQNQQWTLDRVDNNQGHNYDNVLIACLECNIRRKLCIKDHFLQSKRCKIVKLDHHP